MKKLTLGMLREKLKELDGIDQALEFNQPPPVRSDCLRWSAWEKREEDLKHQKQQLEDTPLEDLE